MGIEQTWRAGWLATGRQKVITYSSSRRLSEPRGSRLVPFRPLDAKGADPGNGLTLPLTATSYLSGAVHPTIAPSTLSTWSTDFVSSFRKGLVKVDIVAISIEPL